MEGTRKVVFGSEVGVDELDDEEGAD